MGCTNSSGAVAAKAESGVLSRPRVSSIASGDFFMGLIRWRLCSGFYGCGVEQRAPDEVLIAGDAGQGEEVPATYRFQVLLQGLAVESGLYGDEALLQISLVTDEQQAHVELPVLVHAVGVVERSAQDQVGLGRGSAWVGQADVCIEPGQLALRI